MRAVTPMMLVSLLLPLGCGDGAADPELVQPLATLGGEVTVEQGFKPNKPRVAMAWLTVEGDDENGMGGHGFRVSQDVALSTTFPARFTLELTEPPPTQVMDYFSPEEIAQMGLAEGNGYAQGEVVIYDDLNGNGSLDFTPATAPDIIDRLLGHAIHHDGAKKSTYSILYWEGPPPPADFKFGEGAFIEQGFNLLYHPVSDDPAELPLPVYLPLDTDIDIKIKADPKHSCYLVEPMPIDLEYGLDAPLLPISSRCQDNQPFEGGIVECLGPFGFYLSLLTVEPSPKILQLCGAVQEQCHVLADSVTEDTMFMPLESPPADWPCSEPMP